MPESDRSNPPNYWEVPSSGPAAPYGRPGPAAAGGNAAPEGAIHPSGPDQHYRGDNYPSGPDQHYRGDNYPSGPDQHYRGDNYPSGPDQHYRGDNYPDGPDQHYRGDNYPDGPDQHYRGDNYPDGPDQHYRGDNYPDGPDQHYRGDNYPDGSDQHYLGDSYPNGPDQQYRGGNYSDDDSTRYGNGHDNGAYPDLPAPPMARRGNRPPPSGPVRRPTPGDRRPGNSARPAPSARRMAGWVALILAALVIGSSLSLLAFKPRTVTVGRKVSYQGRSVSGLNEAQVTELVQAQRDGLAKNQLRLAIDDLAPVQVDPSAAGLDIDVPATVERVMRAHQGALGTVASIFGTAELVPVVKMDEAKVVDLADDLIPDPEEGSAAKSAKSPDSNATTGPQIAAPGSEAHIEIDDKSNKLVGVAGRPGPGIDDRKLGTQLKESVERGANAEKPVDVQVKTEHLTPKFTKEDADRLAAEGEKLIVTPLPVKAGETNAELSTNALRPLLNSRPAKDGLRLVISNDKAQDAAAKALSAAGTGATEATFTITNNAPEFVPGKPGTKCCADDSGERVSKAVFARPAGPVELDLTTVHPKFDETTVGELGIKEKIAEFTTTHDPPKSEKDRVHNIHTIADMVKGQVILPGQTFSVNQFVGPRTEEKGFVKDHSIEDGRIIDTVGGGVSQFATTLFNAAWEAGLDIPRYQPHSIYFRRYPKGRDATLSYPSVDLRIKNTTTYGVLIWAEYTNKSLTISLWSTRYFPKVDAPMFDEGGTENPYLVACTLVQVRRTVTLPDGGTRTDSTKAVYQQREGILCNGDQTAVKDEDGNIIREAKPYRPGDPLPPGITAPKASTTSTARSAPTTTAKPTPTPTTTPATKATPTTKGATTTTAKKPPASTTTTKR